MKSIILNRVTFLALPLYAAAACTTAPSDDPSTDDAELSHCVSTIGGDAACYATFTEAIAAATRGKITDALADSNEAFADGTLTDRINALGHDHVSNLDPPTPGSGDVVIGIVYHDAGFHGKDWTFVAPSGCNTFGAPSWAVQNLNTRPYSVSQTNDNISAFKSFAGCGTVVYADWKLNAENPVAGQTALTQDASYVGDALNDRGSSLAWFRM